MDPRLIDEHLADAEDQQRLLRELHGVSTRMRNREIGNADLAGAGMYFPKTSEPALDAYQQKIDSMRKDNDARKAAATPARRPGPSETTVVEPKTKTKRRRAR